MLKYFIVRLKESLACMQVFKFIFSMISDGKFPAFHKLPLYPHITPLYEMLLLFFHFKKFKCHFW